MPCNAVAMMTATLQNDAALQLMTPSIVRTALGAYIKAQHPKWHVTALNDDRFLKYAHSGKTSLWIAVTTLTITLRSGKNYSARISYHTGTGALVIQPANGLMPNENIPGFDNLTTDLATLLKAVAIATLQKSITDKLSALGTITQRQTTQGGSLVLNMEI